MKRQHGRKGEIVMIATAMRWKRRRLPFWRFAWYEPLLMVLIDEVMEVLCWLMELAEVDVVWMKEEKRKKWEGRLFVLSGASE